MRCNLVSKFSVLAATICTATIVGGAVAQCLVSGLRVIPLDVGMVLIEVSPQLDAWDVVLCMVGGTLASLRLVSYHSGRFHAVPLPGLGVVVVGSAWLLASARQFLLVPVSVRHTSGLIILVQLLTFPVFAAIDITERKVPTVLVWAATLSTEVVLYVAGGGHFLLRSCAYALFLVLPFGLTNFVHPGSVGAGDMRLCIFLGSVLSYRQSPLAIAHCVIVAAALAAASALFLRVSVHFSKKSLPMVPFLVLGVLSGEIGRHASPFLLIHL